MDFRANGQNGGLGCGGLRFRRLLAFCSLSILALLVSPAAPAWAIENKPLIAPITSDPPKGTHVLVDADTFTYDSNTQIGIATGKVSLVYGPYTLTATKVVYNQKTGEFDANGSIVLREPNGNVLNADSMVTRNAFRDGFARHILEEGRRGHIVLEHDALHELLVEFALLALGLEQLDQRGDVLGLHVA